MKNTLNSSETLYVKDKFKGMSEHKIRDEITSLDFIPVIVTNDPNYEYIPHVHSEAKLLAILEGSIVVFVGGKSIECNCGDLLIVPGDTVHSAAVGKYGCRFFWSEKIV